MINWVLNMPLILSSYIICHTYGLIADSRFSVLVYYSNVFYILNIRNGLAKIILQKDQINYLIVQVDICFNLYLRNAYNKQLNADQIQITDYSVKYIPIPSKHQYKIQLITKTEKVIKRMRRKSLELLGKINSNNVESYGFKSVKYPPAIQEMTDFENDLSK